MRKDKYRLNISVFDDPEFELIKKRDCKNNYRMNIKEKFSEDALESYEATILEGNLGFDLFVKLQYGTYLYTIAKINLAKESIEGEELVRGFLEVLPDV